eukprot:6199758-Pleurochrysis_carterae.AAC.3
MHHLDDVAEAVGVDDGGGVRRHLARLDCVDHPRTGLRAGDGEYARARAYVEYCFATQHVAAFGDRRKVCVGPPAPQATHACSQRTPK